MKAYIYVVFLVLFLPTDIAGTINLAGNHVVWPTYKFDLQRTGYYDINTINPPKTSGLLDVSVTWKTRADLCIASSPVVGDLNGDGIDEVVYNSCDGYLYIVESNNGTILHKVITGGEFASPTLVDIDGDGLPEVLTDGGSGSLMAIDGDGSIIWVIRDRMFSGSPGIGDFNGDGRLDVAMGSSDGYLYIVDAANGSIITRLKLGGGEASTPSIADIDGDGLPEIVVTESSNLHIIDYEAGKGFIDHIVQLEGLLVPPPPIYDLYGDGVLDAVVNNRDGRVYVVNLVNGSIMAVTQLPGVTDSASPASIGDVDGDGVADIVIATMQGLYTLDQHLNIKYSYPQIQAYTSSPIITDIDLDGENEVIVGLESGEVMIINASDPRGFPYMIEWDYQTNGPVMGSAAIADVDGDHLPEIFIGSRDYYMYRFDPKYRIVNNTSTTTTTTSLSKTTTTGSTTTSQSGTTTSKTSTTNPAATRSTTITTSRSHIINIPTTKPAETPRINIGLVIAALVAAGIIVGLAYYFTRE